MVGMAILILRISKRPWLREFAKGYIALFQGTPLLMQLFLMFFGLPMLGFRIEAWTAAALGLTFFASAYLAEILARRRRRAAARPVGRRRQPRPLAGCRSFASSSCRRPSRITRAPIVGFLVQLDQEHCAHLDHRLRRAAAHRQRHQQRDLRAVHRLRHGRADLFRALLSLDDLF